MRKVRAIRCFSGRSSTTAAAARGEDGGEDGEDGPLQEEVGREQVLAAPGCFGGGDLG